MASPIGLGRPGQASLRRKNLSWDMHNKKTAAIWRARVPSRTKKHKGSKLELSWVCLRKRKVRVAVGI